MESKTMRNELVNEENSGIIEKVKSLAFLGKDNLVTIQQVSNYYEVGKKAINSIIERHEEEFKGKECMLLNNDKLKSFKTEIKGCPQVEDTLKSKIKYTSQITVFDRRGVLRIGMLLKESEIAKSVRDYLLNAEEELGEQQRKWAIERTVNKRIRKSYTDAIQSSGEEERMGSIAYPKYTNMIYQIVIGMTAKEMKQTMGIKDYETPKDYLSKEKLKEITSLQDVAKGFLDLGLTYEQIKENLNKAYNDK